MIFTFYTDEYISYRINFQTFCTKQGGFVTKHGIFCTKRTFWLLGGFLLRARSRRYLIRRPAAKKYRLHANIHTEGVRHQPPPTRLAEASWAATMESRPNTAPTLAKAAQAPVLLYYNITTSASAGRLSGSSPSHSHGFPKVVGEHQGMCWWYSREKQRMPKVPYQAKHRLAYEYAPFFLSFTYTNIIFALESIKRNAAIPPLAGPDHKSLLG